MRLRPVGAENWVTSRDLHILMNEAAEPVPAHWPDSRAGARGSAACGRVLMERSVRAVSVVKSVRGAVPVFRPARFPGPLPEPAVRLSPQRALRKPQMGMTDPLVQLGLDLQYPSFRPLEGGLRIAGIHRRNLLIFHRRPPLTYWTPSPCAELSSARTTTGPPPHPSALGRQRTCPPPGWRPGGRATGGWFPRSPRDHSFREAPSYIPVASPRLRRRPSPWPPARPLQPGPELTTHHHEAGGWLRATDRPVSTRFEPARRLRDFHHWFTRITPSELARRTRIVWSCRHVPPLSGLLPPSPAFPGSGCPQLHQAAATACWRSRFTSTWSSGASWRTKWST